MLSMSSERDYLSWFEEIAPNFFTVRGTVLRVDSAGVVSDAHSQVVGRLTIQQEAGEKAEDQEWYNQPVVWTVIVKNTDDEIVYYKQKVGTASQYDGTRQELMAFGLDALRESINEE